VRLLLTLPQVSVNELINYCFIDPSLGLDREENRIVTQAQVKVLSDRCSIDVPDSWDNITDSIVKECCMLAQIKKTPSSPLETKVVIRRDILQAAGCRATANSVNNVSPPRAETPMQADGTSPALTPQQGDGKMHRPDDIIPEGVFQGIVNLDSSPPPFNFDYPSLLESLQRTSMDEPGVNKVCLLPDAYAQLTGAECTLVTQHDTESVAPDKKRNTFDPFVRFDDIGFPYFLLPEGFVDTPWQVRVSHCRSVHRRSPTVP